MPLVQIEEQIHVTQRGSEGSDRREPQMARQRDAIGLGIEDEVDPPFVEHPEQLFGLVDTVHDPRADGVNFDTYEGVLTWVERIQARAVADDASMPPGGGPGSEDRALLDEWITCTVLDEKARWEAE